MSISKLPTSASLKQVMDKFEEISLSDFSSIDVIVRSELPQVVKNGQVVVIDNDNGKVYMDNKDVSEVFIDENDIYIIYGVESSSSADFIVGSSTKKINIHLNNIYKYKDGNFVNVENVYIGKDGVWVRILDSMLIVFNEGTYKNNFSIIKTNAQDGTFTLSLDTDEGSRYYKYLCFNSLFSTYYGGNAVYAIDKKIDLSPFKSMEVVCVPLLLNGGGTFIIGSSDDNDGTHTHTAHKTVTLQLNAPETVMEVDLTKINKPSFVKFTVRNTNTSAQHSSKVYIKSIIFKK